MRPLEVQRREEAKNRRGGGVLFPGGDGREEAMARRSKTIPKEEPKKRRVPEYYIGEQGVKRKRESGIFDQDERERRARPNPARGNQKLTGQKRKATGPPDPENPQARRKPPPKPEGRLKSDRKGNTKKRK